MSSAPLYMRIGKQIAYLKSQDVRVRENHVWYEQFEECHQNKSFSELITNMAQNSMKRT